MTDFQKSKEPTMSSKEIELAITIKVDAEDRLKCDRECKDFFKVGHYPLTHRCAQFDKHLSEMLRCPACLAAEQALKDKKQS